MQKKTEGKQGWKQGVCQESKRGQAHSTWQCLERAIGKREKEKKKLKLDP